MEIFDFLKRLHDECIRFSEHIFFDKKHPRHLHLVALYGTLIELTGCLITLVDGKHRTGVPPIFRSILEAYVELKNLHEKAEYGYHMDASYREQWIKVLKESRNKPNPYLKAISEIDNLDNQIQEHEKALADLKKKNYTPLNVFQRFERAGMEDGYRSLYNFLSNDAHSNIRALVDRHLEMHETDFTVVFYKDEPLEDFLTYLDSVVGLLTDASMRIHRFFETGSIGEIEILSQELNEIRSHY
ncbi:MAG: hypothetical protein HY882_00685 [Deltaproteobacteria bacterium]|nr:hypothetical protein [Deltaproteobacteria bacterium]